MVKKASAACDTKEKKAVFPFRLLGYNILVEEIKQEDLERSEGGILIPDVESARKPIFGTVVAVGTGRLTQNGQRVDMETSVGDVVAYFRGSGNPMGKYYIMPESAVLAIVHPDFIAEMTGGDTE